MKEIRYSAYFEGKGFYADHQPHYEWSFTNDLNEAKKYKTIKGVLSRLGYDSIISNHDFNKCSVIIEEFETIKENDMITVKKIIIGKMDIKSELKKLEEERLDKFKKKYPLINEPLKVDVIEIPADDPYWD